DYLSLFKILLYGLLSHRPAKTDIEVLADQASDLDFIRLLLGRCDTIIANVRIGGYHDLTIIGRISKDLLIARGTGVKTDFAGCRANFPGSLAMVNRSVSQQ